MRFSQIRTLHPPLKGALGLAVFFGSFSSDVRRNERIKDKNLQISKINSMEDLWHAIEQDEDLLLKPSEIVDDGGEAIDLETFRADLYKMIDEVYAEP